MILLITEMNFSVKIKNKSERMIHLKKLLVLLITVIMVLSVSIAVFAQPGNFIQSPTNNNGPTLIEGENESEDCTAKLVVTPYKDRDTLPAKALADIEAAYKLFASGIDITSLNADFAAFVASKGIKAAALAISDLFDVSYYNCDIHDNHGYFRIRLSADTLRNFVGLLHCNDGVWEFVDNARVLEDGETLEFKIDDLSPFAIVVDTSKGSAISPSTGADNDFVAETVVLCAVSITALAVVGFKKRRA